MLNRIRVAIEVVCLLTACLLSAACQTRQEVVPTLLDLNAIATNDAATAAVNATQNAPTVTPTRSVPTLPPTFTPTVEPSVTSTDPAAAPTITPAGFNAAGTIYYIFNGDSIAALAGDGSAENLVLVGSTYSDLTISPDGTLLTYVAAGSGSAREVFISNREGTYTQQISCLGFASVLQPTWRPDGQAIAFLASQAPEGPQDIYIANVTGANTCPQGNDQHQLVKLGSSRASNPAWDSTGTKFFFSDNYIFGLDVPTNTLYPLSQPSGYGPDFGLVHSPVEPFLAYLRTERDAETGTIGGRLFLIDTSSIKQPPFARAGATIFAQQLRWSPDGQNLLMSGSDSVLVYDVDSGSSRAVVSGLFFPTQAAFSPDARTIAYIGSDPNIPTLQQIFTVIRSGGTPTQLTFHQEGTVTDLHWLQG
jgi:WD40 repeat protein